MHFCLDEDALVGVDSILNCDITSKLPSNSSENSCLELSIVVIKPFYMCFFLYIRFSNICLLHAGNDDRAQRMTDFQSMKNLSKAIDFAKRNLLTGNKIILVCCQNGKLTESTPAPLPPKKKGCLI